MQTTANDDLAQTLEELLAFIDTLLERRTLDDGRQMAFSVTRRLTRAEIDQLFLLDQLAGVQAEKCGLRLPALPTGTSTLDSHLPNTHLRYQCGPGLRLIPTDRWLAEIRAIQTAAKIVAKQAMAASSMAGQGMRLPEEDWMPAQQAVQRANREGVAIALSTVSKWRKGGNQNLKTRAKTLPGRHRFEVEFHSLLLVCHQRAVAFGNVEPSEGSFDEEINRAKAAHRKASH
jgi:hypothetical protein